MYGLLLRLFVEDVRSSLYVDAIPCGIVLGGTKLEGDDELYYRSIA